jgi:hypothetical protein
MTMISPEIEPISALQDGVVPSPAVSKTKLQSLRSIQWAQALVLVALFAVPAMIDARMGFVEDADAWWHMRAGEWILQHHAVPHTDPFSSFGAGKPWMAYSWLFEVILLRFYQLLGMVGLVAYTASMVALITVAMHRMIRRLQADFSFAVVLTGAAVTSLYLIYTPRPWLFSILLFTLELDVLLQARKTGKIRELLWLPLLFALWANLHIQFIDGLVLLGFAVAEAVVSRWWTHIRTRMRVGWLCGVALLCILAPLANPYGWRIYQVAYDVATQTGVLDKITELTAMSFRFAGDWLVLAFAMAAVAVLARMRRVALFETLLLAFAVFVAFRSHRDMWVLVVVASAILAGGFTGNEKNHFRLTAWFAPPMALATGLVLFLGFRIFHVDNDLVSRRLAESLPVRAVEVVKEKGWSGPLYNSYGWGGYLIWSLRMPVGIDGRQNIYGDERINRSLATWGGMPQWATDPDLQKAGLVIGSVDAPLTQLLRLDPRFELGYEDEIAAVFVARKNAGATATGGVTAPPKTP